MSVPIQLGICGLGRIGSVHGHYFSQDTERYELVALCDLDPQRVNAHAGQFGGKGYTDISKFLLDPQMEAVIIATRSLDHARNAEQALAAGKIVLLEKPIGVTGEDYILLQQLDKQYPGKLYFAHNHRFEPAFQRILAIIKSGILGKLEVVKFARHHSYRRRSDWQSLLECGGGQLSVWGPHLIDHGLQCMDAPVREVWGHLKRTITPGDADDHLNVILIGENDVLVELEISNMIALPGPYCTVYGRRGTLVCQDEKNIHLRYLDPDYVFPDVSASAAQPPQQGGYGGDESFVWVEETRKVESEHPMYAQVEIDMARHFYDAVRNGIPFPVRNSDALEVFRITEAIKKQNPQFRWIG
jgi:scyllo-inositol 2-dehydrogenase (NADP+)